MDDRETEGLLRRLAPQVLGALARRYGHLDLAEEAVQEALLAAVAQWPSAGIPDNPRAWMITVASRRLTDLVRNEQARRRREDAVAGWVLPDSWLAPAADLPAPVDDDTLVVLLMCCHAALDPAAQVALTLRAVGGLTTRQIARAFMVPEATMARRITRAKQRIKSSGEPFALPQPHQRPARVAAALHVLYLIFNEGYASTSGPDLYRADLSSEAIRLTRMVQRLLPDDSEATGLLALMLLTEARRPARVGPTGQLVAMAEQDRSLWSAEQIAEGITLITEALPRGRVGPYQLQAAIAAVHDEAPSAEATDWPQIKALYELLVRISDNPMVRLNHAVAVAMVEGPAAGLARLADLDSDDRLTQDHRLHAVRAHLLEKAGDPQSARAAYESAAARTTNITLRRYLNERATRLT